MMLRYCIHIIIIVITCSTVSGQTTFQPKQPDNEWKGIIYRKETAYEFKVHTNGTFAFGVNMGKIKTYYKTSYYHLGIGFLHDPRERSQNKNRAFGFKTSSSFSLGKRNSVIMLRGGMGEKKFISEKAKRKGIAIGYDYQIGPSLALLKPNYLELVYQGPGDPPDNIIRTEKYSEENAEQFLDVDGNTVFGGASYFRGFDELSLVPGIQGKLGLFFSLGAFDKNIKTVETGIMFDLFIKKLPIMIETETIRNRPYFINFYVSLLLGSRKN